MPAVVSNIVIEQGSDFELVIDITDTDGNPIDVTGYSACSQMRRNYDSANAVDFSTNLTLGVLTLTLQANDTATISRGRYVWDAKVTDQNGIVTRVVEGIATVDPETSR